MSCFDELGNNKCDYCQFKDICKIRMITDTTDSDDPCRDCPGYDKDAYPDKQYKIGPRWFTQM